MNDRERVKYGKTQSIVRSAVQNFFLILRVARHAEREKREKRERKEEKRREKKRKEEKEERKERKKKWTQTEDDVSTSVFSTISLCHAELNHP